jgi:hypothetical protein
MKQRGAAGRVLSDMTLIAALSARDPRGATARTRDVTAIVAGLPRR